MNPEPLESSDPELSTLILNIIKFNSTATTKIIVQDERVFQDTPYALTEIASTIFDRNEPCYCGSLKKFKKCHGI
jgi:uncharacterized protein YchJ